MSTITRVPAFDVWEPDDPKKASVRATEKYFSTEEFALMAFARDQRAQFADRVLLEWPGRAVIVKSDSTLPRQVEVLTFRPRSFNDQSLATDTPHFTVLTTRLVPLDRQAYAYCADDRTHQIVYSACKHAYRIYYDHRQTASIEQLILAILQKENHAT